MNGKKIVSVVLFVFLILNMFIFFQKEVEAASIDYIVITDAPNGTELVTVVLPVGGKVTAYASGYNITSGYEGLVVVDWWEEVWPNLGSLDNSTGTSSTFTAGNSGGNTSILGSYTPFINDTFNVSILDPTVDYIDITDTPGGTPLTGGNVPPNYEEWGNCSAYNNTAGYLYTVNADWYVQGVDPTLLGPTPAHGNGINVGTVLWYKFLNASFGGHYDGVEYLVNTFTVDYIKITDTPDGTELLTVVLPVGGQVTAYASSYNLSFGYIGLADVNWFVLMGLGTLDNSSGTSTTFTAGMIGGVTTILGAKNSTINDTFNVSILDPTIDHIEITDTPGGTPLSGGVVPPNYEEWGNCSAYNATAGYLYTVNADWWVDGGDPTLLGPTPAHGNGINVGTGLWYKFLNASFGGHHDFVQYLVSFNVDYIKLTDTPNGTELATVVLPVGGQLTAYASAYNFSMGYIGLADADWYELMGLGNLDNSSGTSTTFTAGMLGGLTTILGEYTPSINDTFNITILDPTIDYIVLTDSPGGTELTTEDLQIDGQITIYASGYNNTAGYLTLIVVDWIQTPTRGSFNNLTGTSTTFTVSGPPGLCTITGNNVSWSDDFVVNILSPTIDYIEITDTPNGTLLSGGNVAVGYEEMGYCSAYNSSYGYIGLVSVDWTAYGGNSYLLNSTPQDMNGINVGTMGATVWFNASYSGHLDSVQYNVTPPTVDYIRITDTPGGVTIPDRSVHLGFQEWGNCSSYNNTAGYIGTVNADWTASGGSSFLLGPTPAHGNGIDVGASEATVWFETYYGGFTHRVEYTVINMTIDYIEITDTPNGTSLTGGTVSEDFQEYGYSSAYNNTFGYINTVLADWTAEGGNAFLLNPTPTTFNGIDVGNIPGLVWLNISYNGHSDSVQYYVDAWTVDYVQIRSAPSGFGADLSDPANYITLLQGSIVTIYGAEYNNTFGFIGDVPSNSTWSSNATNIVTVTSPGSSTLLECSLINEGTATITLDDGSGHTAFTIVTVFSPSNATVDFIQIVDTPGEGAYVIPNQQISTGQFITGYAASYNFTAGYLGDINVSWSVNKGGTEATTNPSNGTSSTFSSGNLTGIATWIADDGHGHTNNVIFDIDIINYTVDYIEITDIPGGTPLTGGTVPVGYEEWGNCSAYNNTGGYLYTVSGDWYAGGDDPTLLGPTPAHENGINVGTVLWYKFLNVSYGGHTDSVQYLVSSFTVDYIQIRDAAGGLGNEVANATYWVYELDEFYAAAYNFSAGYLWDVEVDWVCDNPGVGQVSTPGIWTNFTAQMVTVDSTCTVKALYQSTLNDTTGILTVLAPRVDYLLLTDWAHENGTEIPDMVWNVGDPLPIFASGYNNSLMGPLYIRPLGVNWTDTPDRGDFDNLTGASTIFTGNSPGLTTIKGENLSLGVSDDFQLNLQPQPGNVDYILITDSPNGTTLDLVTLPVGGQITAYASGYNITSGYVGLVEVNWSDSPGLGTFNNPTGTSTTFTAGLSPGSTTITGQNSTLGMSDIFTVNILPPTIDSIILTDLPNGTELTMVILNVGENVKAYASGYNSTSGYIGLIDVNWSESAGLGSFDNLTGTSTIFTAGAISGLTTITGQNDTLGLSDAFVVNINPPALDYMNITDAPDGILLTTVTLEVYGQITAYASGYNNTVGYFGLVEVNWSESAGLGSFDNQTGTSTTFTAGAQGGLTTITGENATLGKSDSFDVNILPPEVDEIIITDAPNGTALTLVTLNVGESITTYASAYNDTCGYIGLINVNWSESAGLGTLDNTSATSTTFTAGLVGGSTTITGLNLSEGVSDSFDVYINPPEADYVLIRTQPGGGGINLCNPANYTSYPVGAADTFYGAMYNHTAGYIDDIPTNATWLSSDGSIVVVTSPGSSTDLTCDDQNWGTVTITLSASGLQNTTQVTVVEPQVDYVLIRTQPGGGGLNLCNPANYTSYPVGATDTFYGAMYNNTASYIDDIPTNATWLSSDSSIVVVTSPGSSTDLTCDDQNWGTVTITLSASGLQNTTQVTVVKPRVDYIQIRDAPNGLGIIITNRTYVVWQVDEFYAAAYNNTADYLFEVEAAWSSDDTSVGTVTANGLWTNFTAQKVDIDGVCHVTASYHGISDSTGALTVLAPRIDSIVIMSSSNGSGDWIADRTYNEGDNDIFWAAGFNNTADYVKDIEATWESNNTVVGMVTSGPSEYANFTAGWKGGYCRITASYDTLTNQTGALFVINVNTLPTAEANYYNGTGFSGGNFTFSTNITVRVTGRKENIVTMKLEENGEIVDEVAVTRHSGQPDIGQISYEMNVQKVYRIVLTYDGHNGGSNPLIVTFDFLGNIYSVHLLFNSQDGTEQEAIIRFNDIIPLVGAVFFDASSSSDFEGYLVDYQWSFGDGTEGSGETVAHTFEENDVYIVNLTVTDDEGGSDTSTITVPVENIDNNNQANAIPGQKGAKGFLNDSGECIVILQCPADMLITNNMGNQIGLSNGIPVDDMEGAFVAMSYSDIEVYYIPIPDRFTVEVDGTGKGLYNLTVILVDNGITKKYSILDVSCTESTLDVYIFDFRNEAISISTNEDDKLYSLEFSESDDDQRSHFILSDMRLDRETTHIYRKNDWGGLSSKEPVTLFIDKDSDGIYDDIMDLETGLSGEEVDAFRLKGPVPGPVFPIMFFVIIGSIFVVGFGALLTEAGKWALLSLFLPLYTRLKREELLDQPTRYKIYGYLLGNPGAYFQLMKEVLELGGGQLVYHLRQLEDANLIYSRADGAKKRFYPTHVPKSKRTPHLFSDIEEKIFRIIGSNSGINQKRIASEMGISRQVAGYHLTQMTRKGVINKKVVGRKTRYYPPEESSI